MSADNLFVLLMLMPAIGGTLLLLLGHFNRIDYEDLS